METIETIAHHHGPRGEVVLRRRLRDGGDVEELIINGTFAMDSCETGSERLLAKLALPSGRAHRVLVGGLGLGHTVGAPVGPRGRRDRGRRDRAVLDRFGLIKELPRRLLRPPRIPASSCTLVISGSSSPA